MRWAAPATGTITESLRRSASFDIATAIGKDGEGARTMVEGEFATQVTPLRRMTCPGGRCGRASVKTCEKAARRERGVS